MENQFANYNTDFETQQEEVRIGNVSAWGDQESRKLTVNDYLLNGVVTNEVLGSVPLNLEYDLQRGAGVLTSIKKDTRNDVKMFPEPSLVVLDLPYLNNDIRAGANSRDTRTKYTPRSSVNLPDFHDPILS
jgi:hypothetical protein